MQQPAERVRDWAGGTPIFSFLFTQPCCVGVLSLSAPQLAGEGDKVSQNCWPAG